MDYILKVESLTKIYGHHKALDNFSMHIPQGAIYGLVGKNGAGKTTLLRVICGLQAATSGDYALYGINNRKHEILNARKQMGAVIETPAIYLDMSAIGNLKEQYRADDLDNLFRKSIRIEVTDGKALVAVLEQTDQPYKILAPNVAEIYHRINISQLTSALEKYHCDLLSIQEQEENLESYYVDLIGGVIHE